MIQSFYALPEDIGEDIVTLRRSEVFHLFKVLRLKKGEPVRIVDGIGNGYLAEIENLSSQKVRCRILSRIRRFGEPSTFVTLAAGLSTGYKFDDILQRGTELGVSRFVPLLAQKAKVKIEGEKKLKSKLARWRKVAISSMKQCGRSLIPEILPPVKFDFLFRMPEITGRKILFDPTPGRSRLADLNLSPGLEAVTIIVGPESGFSSAEMATAEEQKCDIVSMGERVLRTENASPAALAIIMHLLGELG